MNVKLLRYPGSKWLKHVSLWEESSLRPFLPQTDRFSIQSFDRYLDRFPVVFLKPSLGGGGKGVIKVSHGERRYELQEGDKKLFTSSIEPMYRKISSRIAGKKYLIQQGIELITLGGRPMDFRILLLKPAGEWVIMGIMGKRAAKNKAVTNHCRGGSSITLNNAMTRSLHFSEEQCGELKKKLEDLALRIASRMGNEFPNITELGLDVAIDTNERIWLLEANTRPHFELFRHHEDSKLYRTISRTVHTLRSRSKTKRTTSAPLRILTPEQA